MAFDACMVSFITDEINSKLKEGKVEKIYQPTRDEIIFAVRSGGENHRLLVNVGSSNARFSLTSMRPDNPANPPMFCMMLRKHFSGAKLLSCEQVDFERVARITFEAYDDLGFISHKHVIIEIMGTYSNLIVTDSNDKILGCAKTIDFSDIHARQILPGMIYVLPEKQAKADPGTVQRSEFMKLAAAADGEMLCEKFIVSSFLGIAPVVAREIAFLSGGSVTATLNECAKKLWDVFFAVIEKINGKKGVPCVAVGEVKPLEYSFFDLTQYENKAVLKHFETFGELIDYYYEARANSERIHHRASDLSKIISNAEKRISKKLNVLREELISCDEGEKYKLYGDLLTANIYRLKKGEKYVELENWFDEMRPVKIPLDTRMSPAQNAQKYYKKYNKTKSAREHLTEQIKLAEEEYEYIYTVADSLSRAETEKEITEIRSELYHSGYASKMKNYSEKKKTVPSFKKYKTSGGYTVLCGKNNYANDHITFKIGEKSDWWFHVKDMPGSHVLMQCERGVEPDEIDFTEAAIIAACNSKATVGAAVDVDYTQLKNVKKPPASKPGFVIYHSNFSTRVTPDAEVEKRLAVK